MKEGNALFEAIDTGFKVPSQNVSVYFAADGEDVDFLTNDGDWTAYERKQVFSALETYSDVVNLTFSLAETADQANFKLAKNASPQGSLGFMNVPDPDLGEFAGIAWFNTHFYWSGKAGGLLDQGSYTYTIFLHEFGHGLGLAHPHDTAFGSTLMPDIGPGLGLDQGVYTVMTYNDGWPEAPNGSSDSRAWGWNLTPSPIDIALLQE